MGEIADYLSEFFFDEPWEDPDEVPLSGDPNDVGYHSDSNPSCRYCGQTDLVWVSTKHGWRLFDGDRPHRCAAYFRQGDKQ